MKKKILNNLLPIVLLSCLLLTTVLTGCESAKKEQQTKNTETTASSTAAATQAKAEPGIVKIFSPDSPYVKKNYDTGLPAIQEIEKNLNIKIEWELMPYNGYEDALNIKLSAGTDLPDIFMSWGQSPEQLGKNGAVIALNDYFSTSLKDVKAVIDAEDSLKSQITSPDGKVYFLPIYSGTKGNTFQQAWIIRKDWLDKVGKPAPTTADELYDVLKAFRDGDPNGNKKKDEIPLGFNKVDYAWMYTMQWYGLETVAPWDWVGRNKNGEMVSYVIQPEFKENINYMSKLYKEKLINQDILNIAGADFNKSVYGNKVGMLYTVLKPDLVSKIKDAFPDTNPEWLVIAPPKGPNGDTGVRSYGNVDGTFFISKNGKNKDDALRLFNYVFADPVGNTLVNYGIKGMSYELNGDKPEFTEFVTKNPDGLSVSDALCSIGGDLQLPFFRTHSEEYNKAQYKDSPWIVEGINLYRTNKLNERPERQFRFTDEETTQIQTIKSNVGPYINETLAKILVGNESIDSFDKFVNVAKEKGIEQLVKVYKGVEDRTR